MAASGESPTHAPIYNWVAPQSRIQEAFNIVQMSTKWLMMILGIVNYSEDEGNDSGCHNFWGQGTHKKFNIVQMDTGGLVKERTKKEGLRGLRKALPS